MRNDGDAVVALGNNHVGVLKSLVRVASLLGGRRLGVAFRFAQVFFINEEGKLVVFDFDFPNGVFGNFFPLRGHGGNLVSGPLNFFAHGAHHDD